MFPELQHWFLFQYNQRTYSKYIVGLVKLLHEIIHISDYAHFKGGIL